ncbi:MAG TPA: hypothetical protein VNK45_02425 [Candidatus Acidoferrales bacterium]|nr:hypothetical protein [Candidatus Acidoferrales bacterium]
MNALLDKQLLGAVSIALAIVASWPYIHSTLRGETRPHLCSWMTWAIVTTVVFFAQLQSKGGIGAWPTGVSALLTSWVALLAWRKRGDVTVSRMDWVFLLAALSSLPLWCFMADPLWAVVVLTVVDLLGFGPTLRKAYRQPQSEPALFYALLALRNLTATLALEQQSLTTLLFPAVLGVTCLIILGLLLWRRSTLAPAQFEAFQ